MYCSYLNCKLPIFYKNFDFSCYTNWMWIYKWELSSSKKIYDLILINDEVFKTNKYHQHQVDSYTIKYCIIFWCYELHTLYVFNE